MKILLPRYYSVTAFSIGSLLLAGCSMNVATTAPVATVTVSGVHGSVYGGQQPIKGASIQLYEAGTTGYGTGAKGLIANGGVTTSDTGKFTFDGLYSCTTGSQVYVVSVGGDTGAGTNPAAILMAGLGLCDDLNSNTFISMNEVTTVATIWALAPFLNPTPGATAVINETGAADANAVNVGSPATNKAGLRNAFADLHSLVDTISGGSPGQGLAAGTVVPSSEINTLANVLASCVNSTGSGSGSNCDSLFGLALSRASVKPADTFTAGLNIARNPGANVASLLARSSPFSPYQPTIDSANDLTIGIRYAGSGIATPSALAIDAAGNVWITNSAAGSNSVTVLSHIGTPLSGASGFAPATLSTPAAIAIDTSGNAWISNATNNSITGLTLSGSAAPGSPFTQGGLSTPGALSFDTKGNLWVVNTGSGSVSEFSSTGTALSPAGGFTDSGVSAPVSLSTSSR